LHRHDQHRPADHDVAAPPFRDSLVGLLTQRHTLAHQAAQQRERHEQQQHDRTDQDCLERHRTRFADPERHGPFLPRFVMAGSLRRQEGNPPTQFGRTVAWIAARCGPPQRIAERLRQRSAVLREESVALCRA
jgi:hypothetical protein